jgi:CubicO group peptidase (beta-lactamase class C family)
VLLSSAVLSNEKLAEATTEDKRAFDLHDSLSDRIEAMINPYVEHHVFDGSVLIAKNGKIIFNRGFGLASKEWKVPNSADSKYGIGSITKSITAILTMQLVEQKKLSLSDTIDRFLPNIPKQKARRITIHHLLSHTSGLPNYFAIPGWTNGEFNKSISRQQFSDILDDTELQSEPGTQYQYSNIGFFYLGQIIEKITGKDYQTVLSDNILTPLAMNDTGLHLSEIVLDKEATGYQLAKNGGYRKTLINRNLFRASGDIYSTVSDLFKLEQALYANKLLSEKSKSTMFNPENSYGWNLGEAKINGKTKRTISYSGQVLGFNSMLTRYIDGHHSIILLGNIGTSHYHRERLTDQLSQFLFTKKQPAPVKVPLSFSFNSALFDGTLEKQLSSFNKERSDYEIDEAGISALAQQVEWTGMNDVSIKLFEFNAQLFPQSVVSLAKLAAAYQRKGRIKDAISYFSKASELVPDNNYLRQQVKDLQQSLE